LDVHYLASFLFGRLSQVFVGLAAFAFFISIIGSFGKVVQVAARCTHEIGVRKSADARKSQIVGILSARLLEARGLAPTICVTGETA